MPPPLPGTPPRHPSPAGDGGGPAPPLTFEHLWPALYGWEHTRRSIDGGGEPADAEQLYSSALAYVGAGRHCFSHGVASALELLAYALAAGDRRLAAQAERELRTLCDLCAGGAP